MKYPATPLPANESTGVGMFSIISQLLFPYHTVLWSEEEEPEQELKEEELEDEELEDEELMILIKGLAEAGYIPKKYVDDAHDLFFSP